MLRRIEPYWYPIFLVLALAGGLFAYHLATGNTPPRAAITLFGFPIYWYGIWIVTGIALGAWVVARVVSGVSAGWLCARGVHSTSSFFFFFFKQNTAYET